MLKPRLRSFLRRTSSNGNVRLWLLADSFGNADLCPLYSQKRTFRSLSEITLFIFGTMSAFGGKADIISYGPKSPFIAKSGHSTERFAVQC